jgi:hypothetical protein
VAPGQGLVGSVGRHGDGIQVVVHSAASGGCPFRSTQPAPGEPSKPDFQRGAAKSFKPVFNVRDGFYTVIDAEGYVTLRVRTQPDDVDFKPGVTLVGYLSGPDNYSDYTDFGEVDNGRFKRWYRFRDNARLLSAATVLGAGGDETVLAAAEAYAVESGRCSACGRVLTVPASLHRGLGPVCARKLGLTGR